MSNSLEDHLCLKWADYTSNLTHIFDELLQQESLVDVTISSDCGKSIKCHKLVLSANSEYFQKLFTESPKHHFVVVLQDVPWRILIHVIEYMYRGEINVSIEDVGLLLKSARILQIRGLLDLIKPLENAVDNASPSKKRKRIRNSKESTVLKSAGVRHADSGESRGINSACETNKELTTCDKEDGLEVKGEMLEVTPGIMEMDQGENHTEEPKSDWMTTNSKSLHESASTSSQDNLENYQYQLKSLLQKYVDNGNEASPSQGRGPNKSWSPHTMAQAILSVLQKGLSLNRAARSHDIPYPTFVLYANRVHDMLGPSSLGDSPEPELRPKGRGRPQRILKGSWPENLIQQAIQAVVFRKGGGTVSQPPEEYFPGQPNEDFHSFNNSAFENAE